MPYYEAWLEVVEHVDVDDGVYLGGQRCGIECQSTTAE